MAARSSSVWLLALALAISACSLDPVEIGRREPESVPGEATAGGSGFPWQLYELERGVVELVCLGTPWVETEFNSEPVDEIRRVVIELVAIAPEQLPDGLQAKVFDRDGSLVGELEPSAAGLRFEAELELGWTLALYSEGSVKLEIAAVLVDSP